jgi:predicted butyrate kinase (DUF1464 family)
MVLNIGIDCSVEGWKTCLMEHGRVLELCSFTESPALLAYIQSTCAHFPEPIIAVSSDLNTEYAALHAMTEQEFYEMTLYRGNPGWGDISKELLIAIASINLCSYSIPAIISLDSVPAYRKLNRADMGTSGNVCAIATILLQMREREASWSEMNFLYLEVGHATKSIVVVENGCIVNGIGTQEHIYRGNWLDRLEGDALIEDAFWEGLWQDLAGMMAIHHCEDIVVREQSATERDIRRKDMVIERLGEQYQLYSFPRYESETEGYDVAVGAAMIAEGSAGVGPMAEVLERLRIRLAVSDVLRENTETEGE